MSLEAELRALGAWGLSEEAAGPVRRLLKAWERGDTALLLEAGESERLKACAAVGDGGKPTPLVCDKGLLQSWRFREAERGVAERLKEMAAAPDRPVSEEAAAMLAGLYPDPRSGRDQARAIDLGLRRRLAVISGGPGTGKTRTAAWLLAVHLLQRPDLRCVLAAPTGKAARRLGHSINAAGAGLKGRFESLKPALEAVGGEARTLHSLLAWRPGEDRCGRDAGHPLAVDLLIVDEASMMDVLQWRALLAALPKDASLVVLGDPRQLQSVEAGRVLGVLVDAAQKGAGALAGHHVELTENFRFADYPGIRGLAAAVREPDLGALLGALPRPKGGEAADAEGLLTSNVDEALERIWPRILSLASAPDPGEAIKALNGHRVLCAVNEGRWGVDGVNRRIERKLADWSQKEGRGDWCRPVIIRSNDPNTGLSNGDLGVLMPPSAGGRAWFDQGGGARDIALSRLPGHETAWAMSVHRSQGSEYDTVLAILPDGEKMTGKVRDLLSPELLYTAVTRATRRVILCADEAALRVVCAPRAPRVTGLAKWLA